MLSLRRTLAAAIALASWSCGSTQPDATASIAAIVINPASSTLALNAQLPLQALVKDGSGSVVPDAAVTWTVENPTIASVSASGLVTALAIGTTQVAASAMGKSGIATIIVQRTQVASVVVRPNRVDAAIGSTTALTATALDAAQNTLPDRAMIWTTSNAAVATVSAAGVVTAKAAGTATITATSEGKSDASVFTVAPGAVASVTVTPSPITMVSGQTQLLTAAVKDASGTVLTGKIITWASSNTAVATVSSSGVVTAVAAGTATITGTADGVSGSSAVTVTAAGAANVSVSPSAPTIVVGGTTQLTATVTDANGNPITSPNVTWSSSSPLVALVSSTGLVSALLPGTSTITATSGNASGTSAVTVTLVPVASVTVSPPTLSLTLGGPPGQLTATVKDASGNVLTNRPVTWTSSDPLIASVDQTGLVTPVAVGPATITATSGSVSGTAAVAVTQVPVSSVTIAPTSISIGQNATTTLTATTKDASNNVLTGRVITWQTSNANVLNLITSSGASIDVVGGVSGTATITATSEGKTSTPTTITVNNGSVDSVTISLAATTIKKLTTTTATAVAWRLNAPLQNRTINWSATGAATISPSSSLTSIGANSAATATVTGKSVLINTTATIRADIGGKNDSIVLTVTP